MKNIVFCLVLFVSFFVLYACSTAPPAPVSEPAPAPVSTPAPPASAPAPAAQTSPPPVAPPPSRAAGLILDGAEKYTVVKGDTLSEISRRKYQNGFYWPLIMLASNGIVTDQDLIEPGMVLTVPGLQANLNDAGARESMKRFFLETADITNRKRPADAAGLRKLAGSW